MHFLKLSLITFLSFNFVLANNKFSSKECLDSSFTAEIKSQGKFFGLIKNDLNLYKDKCNIRITHKGILESVWNIDICREPIHMKVSSKGSQNVFKKKANCTKDNNDDFCYYLRELRANIDDHGLIFAEGLKENIKDAHGQVYCLSLLINKYFNENTIFSLFEESPNLYKKNASTCELPESKKSEVSVKEEAKTDKLQGTEESVDKKTGEESLRKF